MLRRLLVILGYIGLTALVVAATVLLVAYGQGYAYNFKTGRLIRTALVMIESNPSGVLVTKDGKATGKRTSYRSSFESGSYTFSLSKDGYYPWSKQLAVQWPLVTLAQYVILVPRHPATATLDTRSQIVLQSMSKDHRHLAYVTGGVDPAVYTLDLGGGKPVKAYTPRAATPVQGAETVTGLTWSDDASHLLVVSQDTTGQVHRLMAADGSGAVNLTQQYGFTLTGLTFSDANWRQLYWISADGLRRLDVGSQAVSAVLATNVSQFQVVSGRVLYVQTAELGRTLWSIDSSGRKQELIQALPDSDTYAMDYTNYRGTDELAVVPSKTHVGTLYTDIYGSNPASRVIARDVDNASFSPDGHLLTFWAAGTILTYDLERSALLNNVTSYTFNGAQDVRSLTWFDNFHVLENQGGHLIWREFDGTNTVDLGLLTGSFPAYSTSDNRSVIALMPDGPSVRVQQLTIKP